VAVGVPASGVRAWRLVTSPRRTQKLHRFVATWSLSTSLTRSDTYRALGITRRVGDRLVDLSEGARRRNTDDFSTGIRPGHCGDAACAHGEGAAADLGHNGTKGTL
jgi:hypothetical protein